MTQKQAIQIACRFFTLYLLFWVLSDLISVPRESMAVAHEWGLQTDPSHTHDLYYLRSVVLYLVANLLQIALWSGLALWIYQVPPSIQRFFGILEPLGSPPTPPNPNSEASNLIGQ